VFFIPYLVAHTRRGHPNSLENSDIGSEKDETKAARAWRLAHQDHRPMKTVALTVCEARDLVAPHEAAGRREMTLATLKPSKGNLKIEPSNKLEGRW
jgi:hypothetical protein